MLLLPSEFIKAAIDKASTEHEAIIWGAIYSPELGDKPADVIVYGACCEEQWSKAERKPDRRDGMNHFIVAIYEKSDLQ